ncbi:MAG: chemotaxis protein CheW [Pseudomonadota bacterium]
MLADPVNAEHAEAATSLTLLTFDLAGQCYGIDVRSVREVLEHRPISRLPAVEAGLLGMIDLREQCIPIADLARALDVPPVTADAETRIVVLDLADGRGGRRNLGVMAERVRDVWSAEPDAIERIPGIVADPDGDRERAETPASGQGGQLGGVGRKVTNDGAPALSRATRIPRRALLGICRNDGELVILLDLATAFAAVALSGEGAVEPR